MLDHADEIWNRACDLSYEPTKRGDQALAAVIGFHSLLMNGGLEHCLEVSHAQACRAADSFRLFGAEELARLVDDACRTGAQLAENDDAELTEEQSERLQHLERRYDELVPTDSHLIDIMRPYFAEHPAEFSPISEPPGDLRRPD